MMLISNYKRKSFVVANKLIDKLFDYSYFKLDKITNLIKNELNRKGKI